MPLKYLFLNIFSLHRHEAFAGSLEPPGTSPPCIPGAGAGPKARKSRDGREQSGALGPLPSPMNKNYFQSRGCFSQLQQYPPGSTVGCWVGFLGGLKMFVEKGLPAVEEHTGCSLSQ